MKGCWIRIAAAKGRSEEAASGYQLLAARNSEGFAMLTKEQAMALVSQRIKQKSEQLEKYGSDGDSVIIVESSTIERPLIWVFFYQSKKYLETRDYKYALFGNGPIIVNKLTGDLVQCGSSPQFRKTIEEYENKLAAAELRARS